MSIALTHPAAVASTGSVTTEQRTVAGSTVLAGALAVVGIVGMTLVLAFGGPGKALSYQFTDEAAPVAVSAK